MIFQYQRTTDTIQHGDVIYATLEDYAIARELLIGPLGRSLGGALQPFLVNLFNRLYARFGINEEFKAIDAQRDDPNINSNMNSHLRTIAGRTGAVELQDAGGGRNSSKWCIVSELPEQGEIFLPMAEELGGL